MFRSLATLSRLLSGVFSLSPVQPSPSLSPIFTAAAAGFWWRAERAEGSSSAEVPGGGEAVAEPQAFARPQALPHDRQVLEKDKPDVFVPCAREDGRLRAGMRRPCMSQARREQRRKNHQVKLMSRGAPACSAPGVLWRALMLDRITLVLGFSP